MNTAFETSASFAQNRDAADVLNGFKSRFHFPQHEGKDTIYFCGNSLGLQARSVAGAMQQELEDWQNMAVEGYFRARNPWLYYQYNFSETLSAMMGCGEEEVTVMNTLTVNLHLILQSFYRPDKQRYRILMEAGAFPSDQYALETLVRLHGFNPDDAIIEVHPREGEKLLHTEDILAAIHQHRDSLAVVLMGGINYYTGQFYDMPVITAAAHEAGAYAGWDLAHVAGNIPLELHKWDVDFAVWCSYKYLNGGPGAAGGLYVHERFGNDPQFPRLGGWWGNDEKTRFKMEKGFIPRNGAAGWQISTAQVFNMVALKASLELFREAGTQRLREKSVQLTAYLEYLLGQTKLPFEVITPKDPQQRGAQLSLYFPQNGKAIQTRMMENGIICDYREPGVIRLAPAPLYCSYSDVFRFYEVLQTF
ncbi:kynureninase [Chitinophaga barathri]|uniref:Kynureninase n=1 Tax=Chitinophaga barathri TaxID=1647451 RepID=A0A3N4MGL0_9BACT|nr:kynureninase [Chitinophaga barathri]RPD42565.1 kynureninase [Chitinophaga barathri]